MMVSATMTEAISAKVLVKASGLNSLPSAASMVKTGRKLDDGRGDRGQHRAADLAMRRGRSTSSRFSPGPASSRCRRMFSHDDDAHVDHGADGDGDAGERHDVGVDAERASSR